MRFTSAVLAAFSLLGLGNLAHASIITAGNYTFTASGTPNGQSAVTLTGTIYINSAGVFSLVGADTITETQNGHTVVFTSANTYDSTPYLSNGVVYETITDTSASGSTLQFNIGNSNSYSSISPLVAGNGGPVLCVLSNACGYNSITNSGSQFQINNVNGINTNGPVYFSSVTIAPASVSATPEPSSLILLGTGIMGLAGAARRRIRKA